MYKRIVQKTFYVTAVLWFCAIVIPRAQTPAPDLDSITEDSYQRMLARQAAEHEPDTLVSNQSEPVLTDLASREPEGFYYLIGVFILFGLGLVYWFYRRRFYAKNAVNK